MSLKISTGLVPEWYTLAGQDEAPARFQMRALKGWEKLDLRNAYDATTRNISGSGAIIALQRCIVGWENVMDAEGKPLECNAENIASLDFKILLELSAQLQAISFLSETERKNSPSP